MGIWKEYLSIFWSASFFYKHFKDTESERSVVKLYLNFFSNKNVVVFPILNEEIKNFNIKIFNDNSLKLPYKRLFHDNMSTSSYTNDFFNVCSPMELKFLEVIHVMSNQKLSKQLKYWKFKKYKIIW